MAPKQRYRLKLSKLDFISAVDQPAQETATARLIKRAPSDTIALTARVAKVSAELGLVFGWAFTSAIDGEPYTDLQGDQIDEDFIKAAAEFMQDGARTDEMHDSEPDGQVVFAMPMTAEIATAFGVKSTTSGLMVAIKPSPAVLAKFKSGEYSGFSIAGAGTRDPVEKAEWSTAYIDDLPDSSFLYVEPGGKKDDQGKTTLRSLRHFPYKDENGKVDIAHLRNAISRIPQSSLPATLRNKLQIRAEKILAAQHTQKRFAGVAKQVVLTSEVDGHVHAIDLDDPAGWCGDKLQTTYATSEGATDSHAHVWTFDLSTGAVTIGADSGHTHTLDGIVPPEVLAAFALNEQAEQKEHAVRVLERVLDGDAAAGAVSVTVAARAPHDKSTPSSGARTVKSNSEETTMATEHDKQIADLTKRNERLERIAKMSGMHKAHFDTLAGDDAEVFLAKSATERETVVKAALEADKPIWTGEVTKVAVRARDGELALQLAKQNESHAVELAKAQVAAEKAEVRSIAKAHLGHLAGDDDTHDYIVRSIRKGGGDQAAIDKALAAMKGWNELGKASGVAKGVNPGNDAAGGDPLAIFNKRVAELAKETKRSLPEATRDFLHTDEGAELYEQAFPATRN